MTRDEILAAVEAERKRQHEKWGDEHLWGFGDCSYPDDCVPIIVKAGVLVEEAGEVMKAVLTAGPAEAPSDPDVRAETIQTLAVAWAILEAM